MLIWITLKIMWCSDLHLRLKGITNCMDIGLGGKRFTILTGEEIRT